MPHDTALALSVRCPRAALVAALLLRLAAAALKGPVGTDEALYSVLGHNLWSGKGYTLLGAPHLIFPPLFPWVLGALERLLGSLELEGLIERMMDGRYAPSKFALHAQTPFGHNGKRVN